MKKAVQASHSSRVMGGLGGFAGLYDASFMTSFQKPILATSTDGVGTKVAIAQALDKHDTIGYDLVGMVVDDIVVVGATPLFMTDYIACGRVVPERIASIVEGIAKACAESGVSLIGGETAEHPGLLGPDDYDVAGAATGVVEAADIVGAERVVPGDVVLALPSSGLHSNGFSLVRRIVAETGWSYGDHRDDFGRELGLELLEPTMLYTPGLVATLAAHPGAIHSMSHVTGGGIAQNLSRVLPQGVALDVDRSTWAPAPVFHVLAHAGGFSTTDVEDTWNMGIGLCVVVDAAEADAVAATLHRQGHRAWRVGEIRATNGVNPEGAITEAKGVSGGAVRLVGTYLSSDSSSTSAHLS
jgi:phosphoribosylformylglycinamidine cyclo-ligase